MTVQTIPPIDEMTPQQRVDLMEELWKAMSRNPEDIPQPEWHRDVLEQRERALANGEDEFIEWDEAKEYIRLQTSAKER
jgi:hypothetical protein